MVPGNKQLMPLRLHRLEAIRHETLLELTDEY